MIINKELMEKQIDWIYDTAVWVLPKLKPEPTHDFWGSASEEAGIAVQIRSLKKDFLQARISNLKMEEVRYIDGDEASIKSRLLPIMREMAGLQ